MKRLFILLLMLSLGNLARAQNKTYPKDSVIKVQIIGPFEQTATEHGATPDWVELTKQIAAKYDNAFADRLTNKAQIYYDYGKDWPAFTNALVRYTEKYEDHNNLPLLNKNAKMVLQFSTDKKELETALTWSKKTVDREPGNTDYQATYKVLLAKVSK